MKTLNWSEEEEKLIPQFKDDFPVPEETLKFARRFLHSRDAVRPMVQFMCEALHLMVSLPALSAWLLCCILRCLKPLVIPIWRRAIFLQISFRIPVFRLTSIICRLFDDMSLDPIGAYYQLTGEYRDEATPQDCLEAYAAKASSNSSNTPRFKFVESNYVKALSRGYICEVQEASRIRNAGVLVGLNEFDRPGSVIPLFEWQLR